MLPGNQALNDSREYQTPHPLARRTARSAWRLWVAIGASLVLTLAAIPAAQANVSTGRTPAKPGQGDAALAFDNSAYSTISVSIDGAQTNVRWYQEVCYVAKPILMKSTQGQTTIANPECGYQSMNIFVPESAFDDTDSAIYFAVNNSGWFASYIRASVTNGASYNSATSNVGAALKAGYVFVDVASRSRGIVAADGTYPGKSPAAVVDAKAAVRYLRLNDTVMPGSAERIVVNGTSGGGALTVALGASGNSRDYDPYLAAIGAAGTSTTSKKTIRDDVFAINAYCPITDLGNADIAYEWLYSALATRATVGSDPSPASTAELAAKFAAYQQSLGLTNPDGEPLTVDTMIATIQDEVINAAEIYLNADPANSIPDLGEEIVYTSPGSPGSPPKTGTYTNDWIDVDNDANTVVSLDMERYLAFVATQATLKPAPAFDQSGVNALTMGESTLFGTSTQLYSNFTEYSWDHNSVAGDGSGLDDTGLTWAQFVQKRGTIVDEQVDLIDPMHYIGTKADTAPYWYVRHGTRDRDTAFSVSINLDRALADDADVSEVNYQLAWGQPHAGNYDVPEAMQWIADAVAAADDAEPGHGNGGNNGGSNPPNGGSNGHGQGTKPDKR